MSQKYAGLDAIEKRCDQHGLDIEKIKSRLKKQHECIQYMRGGRIIITNLSELRLVAQEQEEISF